MIRRSQMSKSALRRGRKGFTLIEVIATLVLSSVLAALMLPLINAGIQGNQRPLLRMPATYSLRTNMDNLWQVYRSTYPTNLSGLATAISSADPPLAYSVQATWVDFTAAGVEFLAAEGDEDVLRVTLANAQGEQLTTYFFPIL